MSRCSKTYNYRLLFEELNTEYLKYETRVERMYEEKLDGRITQDLYDKKYNEARAKQEEIKTKMTGLQKADEEYYITSAYLLNIASRAAELFESSEPGEKRELLKLLLLNCTLDGRFLHYDLKKPFDSIFVFGSRQNWLYIAEDVRKCLITVDR